MNFILFFLQSLVSKSKYQIGICRMREGDTFEQACSRISPCTTLVEITDENKSQLLYILNKKCISCAGVAGDQISYDTGDIRDNDPENICFEQPRYVFCKRKIKEEKKCSSYGCCNGHKNSCQENEFCIAKCIIKILQASFSCELCKNFIKQLL